MTDKTTSEVLNLATDLIEERGWVRGTEGWDWHTEGLCIEGALMAAIGARGFVDRTCPAYNAVRNHLDDEPSRFLGIWMWNDRDGRTATEVIEVLRATAVIEAAREQQPAEVSA